MLSLYHTIRVDGVTRGVKTMSNPVLSGKRLINLRGKKSRAKVAKDNNISYSTLQMYECGKRTPRDEIKVRLANYYNTTVNDIFFAD